MAKRRASMGLFGLATTRDNGHVDDKLLNDYGDDDP